MSGLTTVKAKGFYLHDLGDRKAGSGETAGAHFDVCHTINNYTITASFTDSTIKDADNAPWLKDAVFTVETKEGDTDLMLGYDAGSKNAFAGARGRFDIEGKPISLGALWFQKGNHVTLEGKANFNALSPFPRLWATYTLNDEARTANSTRVNLKEREDFAILPFAPHLSKAAIGYEHEVKDFVLSAAYDIADDKAFVGASKFFSSNGLDRDWSGSATWSPLEDVVLVTVGKHRVGATRPYAKAYLRVNLGESTHPTSAGFTFGHDLEF